MSSNNGVSISHVGLVQGQDLCYRNLSPRGAPNGLISPAVIFIILSTDITGFRKDVMSDMCIHAFMHSLPTKI